MTPRWREGDSNYRFPDAPVTPRELESRELLDADPATPLGDAFLEAPRGTESSQLTGGGGWIRTSGSAMRSHRQQRGPGRAA
jgi:hypothetical protein